MNKINKFLKSNLKKKMKITKGLLITFMITGGIFTYATEPQPTQPTISPIDITINNYGEQTGLELGDNSRARGIGSVSTGRNGIAVGKNAVATGENETKETIERKLEENRQRLQEIADAKKVIADKAEELRLKQIRERETIEAGIRVEEIQKSKEKARLAWENKKQELATKTEESKPFFREHQAKIDTLNSKLRGLENLTGADFSSDEGLNRTADLLKAKVEDGIQLNLSHDFYLDYVKTYYKALGDLRENNIIYNHMGYTNFRSDSYVKNEQPKNLYTDMDDESNINYGIYSNDYKELRFNQTQGIMSKNAFSNDKEITNQPNANIVLKNIITMTTTENEYNKAVENASIYKEAFKKYFEHNNNPLFTPDLKEKLSERFNIKIDYFVKTNEITYYQGKYEETRNLQWLDKKSRALQELDKLKEQFSKIKYDEEQNPIHRVLYNKRENWKKENIDNIVEKNKLIINTITSELEKALGINKNAILEKQKELAKLGEQAEQAKKNYEGLNPTESDMILAREYRRVKEEINRLTTDLKNAETRKDNLEKALTLHNLKNVGENQIAFGTDTLAVGSNSIAMGYKAITVGTDSVNIGARGQATGTSITQLGQDLVTNGNDNISIGKNNVINGENNTVFGRNNNVGALGDTNKSNGNIVLGSGITVSKDITNSITLGDGSTPISNAISVGSAGNERQIKNVKDATDNQDAVTYKQLKDYVAENSGGKAPTVEKDLNTTLYKTVDGVTTLNLGDKYEKITPVKLANKVEVAPNTDGTLSEVEINKIKDEIKKANPNIEESLITVDNKGNAVVAGTVFKASENATVSNSNHLVDDTKTQDNPMYKVANTSTDGVAITNLKDAVNEKDAVNLKTLNSKIADKLDKNLTGLTNDDKSTLRTNLDVYSKGEVDKKELHLNPGTYTVRDGAVTLEQVDGEGTKKSEIKINGIVDTNTLTTKLGDKLDKTGANLSSTEKTTLLTNLGLNNTATTSDLDAKANKDLSNVNAGDLLLKALDFDNMPDDIGNRLTYNENKLGTIRSILGNSGILPALNEVYADRNATNISANSYIAKLNESANISTPKDKLVTDKNVKDYLDSNYTNNTTLTTKLGDKLDKTGTNLSETEKSTLLQNLGLNNIATSDNLANKADKDLSNVTKESIVTKAGDGDLDNTNGGLVKDTVVKAKLDTKLNKDLSNLDDTEKSTLRDNLNVYDKTTTDTKLNGKANTDGSNIETDKYIEKLSKGSDISNPTGKLVKDIDVKKYLDEYNPNGSNLDKFMENIDNKFKVTNAGIAQALAMANTITNKEEKEHTISAGVGYYGNEFATAISYSTHQKNVGLKVSASLDSKLKFGLGAGISYTFGRSKTEIKDPVIKTIAIDDNYQLQEENEKLKEKIAMLEDKFNSLNSKLDNINKEEKIVLTGYETNKYVLTDIQKEYLNLIVPKLLDKEIEIIGYTDTVGSDKYNLDLGIRRAEFVKNYLESKGITNISIKSAGFNITLNQNDSIDSKAENRRVEIIVK